MAIHGYTTIIIIRVRVRVTQDGSNMLFKVDDILAPENCVAIFLTHGIKYVKDIYVNIFKSYI